MVDPLSRAQRLIELRGRIIASFDRGDWEEVGLLSGMSDLIKGHDRLLRSLHFKDDDYEGNVLIVLGQVADRDPRALKVIEDHLAKKYPGEAPAEYVSSKPSERKITFAPTVFQLPEGGVEQDLVGVMMPFEAGFAPVYEAMKSASQSIQMRCQRVDEIWLESAVIQDIFNLIFRSHIVVVDITGKNPNVMYEMGIAHTMGKHVVPIAQSLDGLPFDMAHHRVLKYLPNSEGLKKFESELAGKLAQLGGRPWPPPRFDIGFTS